MIKAVVTDFDLTLFDTTIVEAYPKGSIKASTLKKDFIPRFRLYDGWRESRNLMRLRKIPFGIVSHNTKTTISETLKKHKVDVDFVLSRYGENFCYPNLRVVPKAELLEQALNQPSLSGLKREEILYLGDAVYDVEQAKEFGCKAGACFLGTHEAEALNDSQPDYKLYSPKDLLEILGLVA